MPLHPCSALGICTPWPPMYATGMYATGNKCSLPQGDIWPFQFLYWIHYGPSGSAAPGWIVLGCRTDYIDYTECSVTCRAHKCIVYMYVGLCRSCWICKGTESKWVFLTSPHICWVLCEHWQQEISLSSSEKGLYLWYWNIGGFWEKQKMW